MERSLHSVESAVESIHRLIAGRVGGAGGGPLGLTNWPSNTQTSSPYESASTTIPFKRPFDHSPHPLNRHNSNDAASQPTPKRCEHSVASRSSAAPLSSD